MIVDGEHVVSLLVSSVSGFPKDNCLSGFHFELLVDRWTNIHVVVNHLIVIHMVNELVFPTVPHIPGVCKLQGNSNGRILKLYRHLVPSFALKWHIRHHIKNTTFSVLTDCHQRHDFLYAFRSQVYTITSPT